ncbi:MAG: aminotransferase class I/II-fold pyridoxal phosphate-dependent enzyme [Candidatus Aenigmatarchaeota archaeon]
MPEFSQRLESIPQYPFARMGRKQKEVAQTGRKIYSLRIGDPNDPPSELLRDKLCEAIQNKDGIDYCKGYPMDRFSNGLPEFVEAIVKNYKSQGIDLKPSNVCVSTLGWSKPLMHHAARIFKLSDKNAIVTDPVYPLYESTTLLADPTSGIERLPTRKENGWMADFSEIPQDRMSKVSLAFLNYPNNPTGAVATEGYWRGINKELKRNDLGGIIDECYYKFRFDGKQTTAASVPEILDNALLFYSFSKDYNMTGIGLSYAISSEQNINRLVHLLELTSQGTEMYKQKLGAELLTDPRFEKERLQNLKEISERKDIMVDGLNRMALKCELPPATPFQMFKVPDGYTSEKFAFELAEKTGVVGMPGEYLGKHTNDLLRLTPYQTKPVIEEAMQSMKENRFW